MEVVISSLISAISAIIVCVVTQNRTSKEQMSRLESRLDIVNYQITELSERVNKHNNVIDRTYHLEERSAVFEEKIKVANHRLDDLESANKK